MLRIGPDSTEVCRDKEVINRHDEIVAGYVVRAHDNGDAGEDEKFQDVRRVHAGRAEPGRRKAPS